MKKFWSTKGIVFTSFLIIVLQIGFAGIVCGDLVVNVEEDTIAGTINFSYGGTLDVDGLGTPTSRTFFLQMARGMEE
jgi:hypothetical protein